MEKIVKLEGLELRKGYMYFVKAFEDGVYVCESETTWHRKQSQEAQK